MIVHAYLTDGFFPWAKLFLESYCFHNGVDIPVILSTRNLNNEQISELYQLYSNLKVENEHLDLLDICKQIGITEEELLQKKHEVETFHVTENNKVWKLFIAGDNRVKSILSIIKNNQNQDYVLHMDIDSYIRSNLSRLFQFIKQYDVSIRLRLNHKRINRKTKIGIQGYRICDLSIEFLEKWIYYIDRVSPYNRRKGYGQTSCYYAYLDLKDKLKWGNIPGGIGTPRLLPTDIIWSANNSKGKEENLKLCYTDFEIIKTKGENI